ncbi:NAD(P)H-dependent oxidoreductase [Christensenellaceae bacterium OttesenSCG-928-K19]|nr:NAD(P)H-dependent oxidoreductase [Christensenellaceae bacterium OttesenSCG-928-K19]
MVLFINACLRAKQSRTKSLCDSFLEEYARLHPEEAIETVDLCTDHYNCLTSKAVEERDALVLAQNLTHPTLAPALRFAKADKLVIGAPYWDVSFPAALKCYIENICVNGVTFLYTPLGPKGLCNAKKMLYISTTGGPVPGKNAGFAYMEELCNTLLGINDCAYFAAGMLDVEGQDVSALLEQARTELLAAAPSF